MIRPNVVVVTCIGSEHNRSFKTLEATRKEKSEMVAILPPTGLAVLNGDDPNVMWMRSRTSARIITYGFGKSNDVRAEDVSHDWPRGMRFTLQTADMTRVVRT
jgi:UDP-N-acetylmuramoyl-tripeptide--D-alanyl-D-alanine ligase